MATSKGSALLRETTTREQRALALFREHRVEIREIGADLYDVPSASGAGTYTVDYEDETCSCQGHEFHTEYACKHLLTVGILYAKTHRHVSAAGDPFVAADRHREECPSCFGGYGTLTIEEDGREYDEAVPCQRCAGGRESSNR